MVNDGSCFPERVPLEKGNYMRRSCRQQHQEISGILRLSVLRISQANIQNLPHPLNPNTEVFAKYCDRNRSRKPLFLSMVTSREKINKIL